MFRIPFSWSPAAYGLQLSEEAGDLWTFLQIRIPALRTGGGTLLARSARILSNRVEKLVSGDRVS
jgi:hypothetical protein